MKSNTPFTLSVPQPCTESWQEMTPDEKGRFCQHCQQTVVDFSNMTDKELVNYFSTASGKVCGRFMPEQLNREAVIPSESRKPFLSIAAMLSALYFFIPAAKATVRPATAQTPGQRIDTSGQTTKPVSLNRVISGTVVSSEIGDSLRGVAVRVKNTYYGVMTDDKGHFRLELPYSYNDTSALLVFSYVGFYSVEMNISLLQRQEPLCIALGEGGFTTGDVVIVQGKRSLWQKLKGKVVSIFR